MKNKPKFAVIGGDDRLLYAAQFLAEADFDICTFGVTQTTSFESKNLDEALSKADFVLLPIPTSRDGKTISAPNVNSPIFISEILEKTADSAVIFSGMSDMLRDDRIIDYGKSEDFAVSNAIPTAEGAMLLTMSELHETVSGMNVGVIGFGKVGTAVARLFHAANANVTVFARKETALRQAESLGYRNEKIVTLPEKAKAFTCLINTVPALILDESALCGMRADTLIIELASAPFGIDFDAAEKRGIRVIRASGLPGKYFPKTAGEIIARTVLQILNQKNLL